MGTKLAVHWIPVHGRPTDLEYMRQLQPRSVKIVDPDVQHIADVYKVCPDTLIVLRDWALSEQKDDMKAQPTETGTYHARRWREKIEEWRRQARERGLTLPLDSQLLVVGINEPPVWEALQQTVDYTVAFLDVLSALGLRGGALNLSVGWPANTGTDTPPDWKPYAPVEAAIQRGGHTLVLHEYWSDKGPAHMWGWWAGRYEKCPWNVPILMGECGLDQYVESTGHGKKRGWQSWMLSDAYRYQLADYDAALRRDPRIHSAQIFTTDGNSQDWADFDTAPAHAAIVAYAKTVPKQPTVPQPGPAPQPEPIPEPSPEPKPVPDGDKWERSLAFTARWERGYQNIENDKGNWTGCEVGVGENKGTKYGVSACSYPDLDIMNLTREQAHDIFKRDYWGPSGAADLPWPSCLLVFDTAILHGVGTAKMWIREVGPNPYLFAAKRLRVYTKLSNWDFWGKAWVLRTADLLEEMAT